MKKITLDGMMTVVKLDNGLRAADFECCEDVTLEAFEGKFKVQGMRDGNLYMTELKKPKKNRAIFREDNASLTLGRDGKYYFYFSLPEQRIGDLPQQLQRQAGSIARKVIREILYRN